MTFPVAQRDVAVEMLLLGGWTDVTSDVRLSDGIKISRGRSNETADVSAPTCTLTLDNRTGKYSTRNPTSPYYPGLGRNTPMRVAIRTAKDTFTGRTVANGWGTAEVGGSWSFVGTAGDFAVGSGVGTMLITTTNTFHLMYQGSQVYRDVDVAATVSLPFSDVTGGNVEPCNLVVSGLSTSDYFMVSLKITTAEALTMQLNHVDGTNVASTITVPGITYTGQALRVRCQVDGQTLRAKVWPAAAAEPYAWTLEGRSDRLAGRAAGWAGIRSGVGVSNTNIPVTFSYDNVEVRSNRFAGEIASFPPERDPSGKNVYTKIQAGGLLRRLTQGASPLKSTYRRGNETISPAHVAYWPVEEGAEATSIASGIGGSPMSLVLGTTTFATNSDFPGSAPIAKSAQSRWVGPVPKNASTGQIQLVFLLSVPLGGEADQATLAQIQTSGTAAFIDVFYQAAGGGGLKVAFYDRARVAFHTSGTIPFALNGRPVQLSVELTQSGGDVGYSLATLDPGQSSGAVGSGTATGCTIASVTGLFMNAYRQATSSSYGHVAVRNQITSIFTLAGQLNAYNGEIATTRTTRLCTENSLPSSYLWDGTIAAAALGFQSRATLPDLLKEAAKADFGSLYDSRNHLSFQYRARSSLYNQSPVLALDYTAPGHIPPPFKPVEDDQALHNDFTATRKDGSSFQAVQTTGRLAVTDPVLGTGVGRYDDGATYNLYADDQVQSTAGWALTLGTVDEARYPTITVKLAALANVSQTLALAALMVNLDDKITVANPPMEIAPGTISQLARGYNETIKAFTHDIVFNCAPASPYEVVVLDDTARGRIDSDTSTLAGAATSGATTLYVTDTSGAGWTTAGGDMPIPITVGGEDMSVTAIANELLSNTGFESALSPWASSGASSFTQSGTQKHSGSFAARLVPTGAAARTFAQSELIPVTAGQQIRVSGWMWCTNAVTANASVGISWYDASLANLSESHSFVSVSATTWTQLANTFTVPAGIAYAQVVAVVGGTPAAGQIFYVDDASLTGPQKFTVTRSVNGVVKAQTAGTQVSLTRRAAIAL